ncbi:MAG: hypothetical protein ACHQNV_02550 [Vicinamibacteria bacterium]
MRRWVIRLLRASTLGVAIIAALFLHLGTEDYPRYLAGRRASLTRVHVEGTTDESESRTCRAAGLLGGWLLRPLEPLCYAEQIAPMPLLMVAGTEDARIPRENVEAFFARAREPKRIVWIEAGHVDPRHPELLDRIIALLARELRALNVL